MTDKELAEIEARVAKATPGPWDFDGFSDIVPPSGPNDYICVIHYNRDDADFIAHSRQDIPALIAEIKRLQEIEQMTRKFIEAEGPGKFHTLYDLSTSLGYVYEYRL